MLHINRYISEEILKTSSLEGQEWMRMFLEACVTLGGKINEEIDYIVIQKVESITRVVLCTTDKMQDQITISQFTLFYLMKIWIACISCKSMFPSAAAPLVGHALHR